MRVTHLIKVLLDQPGDNDVFIAGTDPETARRTWDGSLETVQGSGQAGIMSTYITFNQTGLNAYLDDEEPYKPTWLTTYLKHAECDWCQFCRANAIEQAIIGQAKDLTHETASTDGVIHRASILRNPK